MPDRLRVIVRALRGSRILGPVVRAADRLWWGRAIHGSALVDSEFYGAQLGLARLPRGIAIAHYVIRGFRRGMSLNPLFDDLIAGADLPEVLRVPALYAYLVSERHTVQVHPWWDAVDLSRRVGSPGLEHLWSDMGADVEVTVAGRSVTMTVSEFRRRAIVAARTWRRPRTRARAGKGAMSSTVIVRPLQAHDRRYARKLVQLLDLADTAEIVVPLVGVDASQWISAHLLAGIFPELTLRGHRCRAVWGAVISDAVEGRTSGVAVVLDARAEFSIADVRDLEAAAREGAAVIPAHRAQDGTVAGLGAADVGGRRPWGVLEAHPVDDIDPLDDVLEVPLLHGRTLACPLDALAVALTYPTISATELSRRLPPRTPRRVLTRLRPLLEEPQLAYRRDQVGLTHPAIHRALVEPIIDAAGFDVESWPDGGKTRDAPRLRWRAPHAEAQRWAIKICAPAGRQGAVWGDAHFARGLAAALRRRGHMVVVDAFDARDRLTSYLDDVNVVVRGPYRIDPPRSRARAGVNLLWIISHPDAVTRNEVVAFDRVFAASESWSRASTARWGVAVESLLECTDTDLFHPRGVRRTDEIVFVGTARGIARPSVVVPLAAGIPVRVYGPDWRPFISQSAIVARSLPHEQLAERYESASIVLNDQWPEMRRHGFIAMRPFDVVAVGGRVISEEVEGIDAVFEGAVVTYRDAEHLVSLLQADPDTIFPDADALARASERIRRDHSFDARAAVLDEAARSVLSADEPGLRHRAG